MLPRDVPTTSPVNLSTTLNSSLVNISSHPNFPSLAPVAPRATDQETSDVGVLFLYFLVVGAFFLFILYVASNLRFATEVFVAAVVQQCAPTYLNLTHQILRIADSCSALVSYNASTIDNEAMDDAGHAPVSVGRDAHDENSAKHAPQERKEYVASSLRTIVR
jgi:hypothetical protein